MRITRLIASCELSMRRARDRRVPDAPGFWEIEARRRDAGNDPIVLRATGHALAATLLDMLAQADALNWLDERSGEPGPSASAQLGWLGVHLEPADPGPADHGDR